MAPYPEQVGPEHIHPAVGHRKELRAEQPVEHHQRQCYSQYRECEQDDDVSDEHRPGKHRHFHQLHPWRTHLQNRHQEVHCGHQCPDPRNLDGDRVIVVTHRRAELDASQREVCRPSGIWGAPDDEGDVKQHRSGKEQPEADGVQSWKRNVARTDLQRNDYVHQTDNKWHRHKQDHNDPVCRKNLVIMLRVQQSVLRYRQLGPHEQRIHAAPE
ncbi:hypothetical protein D3C74_282830 [compost metagenome]